ncbi:MAG: hypothetical protein WD182_06210 [Bacteroidota bacterium]
MNNSVNSISENPEGVKSKKRIIRNHQYTASAVEQARHDWFEQKRWISLQELSWCPGGFVASFLSLEN